MTLVVREVREAKNLKGKILVIVGKRGTFRESGKT